MTCRRVLIVGGSGFVGAHLARRCIAGGHDVHVLARPGGDAPRLAPLGDTITIHRVVSNDPAAIMACLDRLAPEWIFDLTGNTASRHSAGVADLVDAADSIRRLTTLIQAASLCRQPPLAFIRTGSIAEYGAGPVPYREHQREQPVTAYGAGLVAGTHLAGMIAPSLRFPLSTARLALIYGSGQDPSFLIPSLIEAVLSSQQFRMRRPEDRRDVLHVSDVVDALVRLAEEPPAAGAIVNIGSDTSISVNDIAALVGRIAEVRPRWNRDEQLEMTEHRMSVDRIRAGWGWVPKMTMTRGIAATIADRRVSAMTVAA